MKSQGRRLSCSKEAESARGGRHAWRRRGSATVPGRPRDVVFNTYAITRGAYVSVKGRAGEHSSLYTREWAEVRSSAFVIALLSQR